MLLSKHGGWDLHIPYHDNDNENIAYYNVTSTDNADDTRLYRTLADGSSEEISPQPGGIIGTRRVSPWRTRWGIVSSFQNRNYMAFCGQGSWTIDRWYFYTSEDAGSTWTLRQGPNTGYRRVAIAGDTTTSLYLWGTQYSIAYSNDFGATIQSKAGNLSDFYSDTNNEFIGICGG